MKWFMIAAGVWFAFQVVASIINMSDRAGDGYGGARGVVLALEVAFLMCVLGYLVGAWS